MIIVFGSINMDLVAQVTAIARPGETVLSRRAETFFGGKGANQAVAAARAASDRPGSVAMAGAVGEDAFGESCRSNLRDNGVDIAAVRPVGEPTGCAFIAVDASGENAITVAQPSTPASHFHRLRLQALDELHRPLIVMTPKSMLRNKQAVSQPEDFTEGSWQPVLADPTVTDPGQVEKVILCSGKVRWDLLAGRASTAQEDRLPLMAVESLYPLPKRTLAAELAKYPNATELRWVQDEPENQGAWPYMALNLLPALTEVDPDRSWTLSSVPRAASSAPSVGSAGVHQAQQRELIKSALA